MAGIEGYCCIGTILLWLFPLRPDPTAVRAVCARADVKKVLSYSAQRVFQAICETYEDRYKYGLEWKDAENLTVCIRKEKRHFVEKYEDRVEYLTVSVTYT